MKLYENVAIGNFLYGLGLSIGNNVKTENQLSVINLLQQTPQDTELGDALLEFPEVVKLIEFKNKDGSFKKEKRKVNTLKAALGNDTRKLEISRETHWYIETAPFEKECLNKIVPYLDAFENEDSIHTFESFINEIVQEIVDPSLNIEEEEYRDYLSLVAKCNGGSGGGTGGIIVSFSQEKGLRYVQFANTMELRLQDRDYVKKYKSEYESMMKKEIKREKEREFSRGHSLKPGGHSR